MSARRFEGERASCPQCAGVSPTHRFSVAGRDARRLRAGTPVLQVTIVTAVHDARHSTASLIRLALPREHRSVQRTSRAAEGGPTKLSLHGRVSPCFLTFPSGHEPKPAGRMGTVLHAPARSAQSDLPRLILQQLQTQGPPRGGPLCVCVIRHMSSCMTSPPRIRPRSTIQMLTRPCDGGRTK